VQKHEADEKEKEKEKRTLHKQLLGDRDESSGPAVDRRIAEGKELARLR
jgi:hypothetical protein